MPNWCRNTVYFNGDNVNKVDKLFDDLIKQQNETGLGVRPDWNVMSKEDCLYMFDIDKHDSGSYAFNSRWSPAIVTLFYIGRRFKVAFEMTFDECSYELYGKYTFNPSQPNIVMLQDASNTSYGYDEYFDMYTYNGEKYESMYDFLDDVVDSIAPSPIIMIST